MSDSLRNRFMQQDPYANEIAPRFVKWIDSHPVLAPVLMVAFILLALGVAGWIDHGGPL